jgi:hypothetical protein
VVSELVNRNLTPGTFEVKWNAAGVSSGVYFYQITTEDFSAAKRMILSK